jgi:DNA-binding XRE family transcriptional regulator
MAAKKWIDVRPGIVERLEEDLVVQAHHRNQAYIDGHRLKERRLGLSLTQAQVAQQMGVTKSRVSQIERGEVSTVDAIARYVQALNGHIQVAAVFGDDLVILRGADTQAA